MELSWTKIVSNDFNIQHSPPFLQCDVMNQSMLDLIHAEDRQIFQHHMQLDPQQTPPEPPQEGDPPTMPEYAKYGFTAEMFRGGVKLLITYWEKEKFNC